MDIICDRTCTSLGWSRICGAYSLNNQTPATCVHYANGDVQSPTPSLTITRAAVVRVEGASHHQMTRSKHAESSRDGMWGSCMDIREWTLKINGLLIFEWTKLTPLLSIGNERLVFLPSAEGMTTSIDSLISRLIRVLLNIFTSTSFFSILFFFVRKGK